VEEVGSSNAFFMIGDEIITAPLAGTILPGITRDSVITLLKEWGVSVCERKISIEEVIEAAKNGTLKEAFASGTAAVISPMGLLHYLGDEYTINDRKVGGLSQKLYDTITGYQTGKLEDTHDWIVRVV
jgi:branched-chain amino acid aminotransferase